MIAGVRIEPLQAITAEVYSNLMAAHALGCDEFDAHVLASILAISWASPPPKHSLKPPRLA